MEAGTVRVDRAAARPVGQAAVDAIERLETILPRGLADNGAEIARVQPSFAGDHALLVRRQPFDLPRREEEVRKCVRCAPEDSANDSRPACRAIEVHDVRELVREHQTHPVVELGTGSGRRHRVQDHGVVRHRRGVPVVQFGLIGEHDLRSARRCEAERPLERAPRLFGDARQPLRQPILSLVKVDDEMFGRQRAEPQRRVEQRDAARGPGPYAGEQQDHRRRQRARHGRPHHRGAACADVE